MGNSGQDYLDKSGDGLYKVGQRIVVKEGDVLRLLELVEKLTVEMKSKLL